jgi:phenylpropionate dioxygenase-like ring-hydroxylating dioxygenase large terminal subunit
MTSLFRHPRGWFYGAMTRDLAPGGTLRTELAGQPIVIFRTERGALGALDAHCPHLGAPLARGTVEGESLRCTLHGMRWSPDGSPAEQGCPLQARSHPVIERHGFVFVHHDPDGLPPAFDIPALDDANWTPLRMRVEEHDVPPVVMLEPHASDSGHNAFLHHEQGVEVIEPFRIEGDQASGAIRMKHPLPAWSKPLISLLGASSRWAITDVHSRTYGVGYQYNTSHVPAVGVLTHLFMLPVPLSATRTRIHIGYALERFGADVPRAMRHLPRQLLDRICDPAGHHVFMEAIDEHVSMWSDQRMIEAPQLRPGEEAVGQFRAWARRFYGEGSAARNTPSLGQVH